MNELYRIASELKKVRKEHSDNYKAEWKNASDIYENRRKFISKTWKNTSTSVIATQRKLLSAVVLDDKQLIEQYTVEYKTAYDLLQTHNKHIDDLKVQADEASKVYEYRLRKIDKLQKELLKFIDDNEL